MAIRRHRQKPKSLREEPLSRQMLNPNQVPHVWHLFFTQEGSSDLGLRAQIPSARVRVLSLKQVSTAVPMSDTV